MEILSIVLPDYSSAAVLANTEGAVVVTFIVGVDGVVTNVVAQAPNGTLAEAARLAISQWRFAPPIKDGKPIAIRIVLPIDFRLVDG